MSTTLAEAAHALYNSVQMPVGTYNVVPLHTSVDDHLEVWVDKKYLMLKKIIPQNYLGFRVVVKEKPLVTAYT